MMRNRPTPVCVVAGTLLVSLCGNAHALWGSDPEANFAIADRSGEQVLPKIVNDWSGGGYVGWFDSSAGAYQVYLQRLDGMGFEFWGHNGLLISDHPQSTSLVDWDLLLERDGDAIVAFTDTRAGSDLDVYLYRIGQNGAFVWGDDGITVSANDDYEPSPALCQASDGDVVVVWPRLPDVGDGSLRMQRYAPDGTPRFAAGGIDIVTAPNESPAFCRVIPSDDGSVIVGYLRDIDSFSAPRHLRAVKVAADGTIAWGPLAVYDAVSLPIGYQPQMVADTAGGAIFCFHRSQSNIYNSVVQRVTSAGAEVFPTTACSSPRWPRATTSIRVWPTTPRPTSVSSSGTRRRPTSRSGGSACRRSPRSASAPGVMSACPRHHEHHLPLPPARRCGDRRGRGVLLRPADRDVQPGAGARLPGRRPRRDRLGPGRGFVAPQLEVAPAGGGGCRRHLPHGLGG
ncbi:MAG: hypothetical protein IPK72_21825 [Candidatus Eisenbacteria bacterium]|nr:hypothetical protein [Candidatus Eisenbacteria bacterium]